MAVQVRAGRKKHILTAILLSFSVLAAQSFASVFAGSDAAQTEASDAGANAGSDQTESARKDGTQELYHENEWGFVEDSMDISGGIPDYAAGRLSLIRDRGKLIVVTDPYFPPQEFIDPDLSGQDQYAGADMELARLIAERMGVELEIVPLDFNEVLTSMSTGKYDLAISALSYTPGRASSMELSKGYHYTTESAAVGLIIREDSADIIKDPSDLSGRDLAAQSGSLQELLVAQNIPDYRQFRRLSSVQEVYDEVSSGSADAAGVDIESARLYIRNNPDCGLMLMDGVEYELDEQFHGDRIAGPNDDLELMYFINGVIDEVLSSGQYEEWFSEAASRAAELNL